MLCLLSLVCCISTFAQFVVLARQFLLLSVTSFCVEGGYLLGFSLHSANAELACILLLHYTLAAAGSGSSNTMPALHLWLCIDLLLVSGLGSDYGDNHHRGT
jgi:hypothetical protein